METKTGTETSIDENDLIKMLEETTYGPADYLEDTRSTLLKTTTSSGGSLSNLTNGNSNAMIGASLQINSQPLNQNIWTTTINAGYDDPKPTTVELKTIDGKRHIVRFASGDSLDDIEERTTTTKKWSLKFPFLHKETKTYTHFRLSSYYHTKDGNAPKEFDVDCSLSAFCKLLDIDFKSFSSAILEDAVENG